MDITTAGSIISNREKPISASPKRSLATIFSMVFTEFLVMGISLGVLPEFIHQTLHLSNVWVGVVIGTQYITTLATRQFAGKTADHNGSRRAVITGILTSAVCGLLLVLAAAAASTLYLSLALTIAGRIMLGIGESFLVVGIFTWGFALVGHNNTGKVMVWNGMGMYAGMACGAPLGIWLQHAGGINTAFAITIGLPLLIYFIIRLLPAVPLPQAVVKLPFYKAVGMVLASGSALAFASIGFGGIASFIPLYFIQNHWQNASFALTAFGACYMLVRIFLSGAPDKFGGARVALVSLIIEIAGQLLIWGGFSGTLTIAGAALTGTGMSLIFPSLGQIAMQKVAIANRGMAVAAYNAFFDMGMGLTAPIAGLIAGKAHYQNVYLFGTIAALTSFILVYREIKNNGVR